MKNVIVVTEKSRENKKLLAIENIDKTIMVEVTKVLSAINLRSKHNWAISNVDIDVARDLRLIYIQKYWRHIGQIQDDIN